MKKFVIFLILMLIPFRVNALASTASSAVLMDMDSGRILYEKNKNDERLVASITKIMTAVIAIENGNLDDVVTVGKDVLTMYGSNIYIELGEKMKLKDLLYGLLLRSGNDAAIVIAVHIGGSEEKFVEMMNKKAKQIGMKNTVYKNSHGLDEVTQNYSSAYDMALLSSYANKLDVYREISGTKKWTLSTESKTYVWHNRNKLLSLYEYATGGKTGYTPSAGRTLVTTASKDNFNLTAVTLNDGNEYDTHESLYEYAFNKYKKYLIVDKDNFSVDNNFYKDKVYIKKSLSYPLSEDELDKIRVVAKIYKLDDYKNGDQVGELIVSLEDKLLYKEPIYVSVSKSKSWWSKLKELFSR